MKWVVLVILCAAISPASSWLRKNPDKLKWPCFLIGFLPFVTNWYHLLTAPVSWAGWIGYAKGFEIYVVDFVALVILISLRGRLTRPPFILPMAMYFIASVIAACIAQVPEAGLFYCWQLLRVFLIYYTVANVCTIEFDAVTAILKGLAAGEVIECVVAIWQRFGQHVLQTPGTLDSQNELGIATHFVVLPFFAVMLGGRRGWLPGVVVLAGLIADALTTSRASVLLVLTGIFVVWLLSSSSQFSARKFAIAVSGLIALALMAPLALASFNKRFEHSNLGLAEDVERVAFKRAAWMMLEDHPAGVGPNNFALVANVAGYYSRAGGGVSSAGRRSNVHNVYVLIWAETGPLGLACYLLMFATVIVVSLRYGAFYGRWEHDDPRRDVLIGASVTLMIACAHSTEEWVMIVSVPEYLIAIMFGFVAALTAEARASKGAGQLVLSPS